jgi:hypothetical protein
VTLLYGFSVLYCRTAALAHGGAGPGTLGLPEARLRTLADAAVIAARRTLSGRYRALITVNVGLAAITM